VIQNEGDSQIMLAQMQVEVAHLKSSVVRLEAEYTKLARFLPVEKAVFGLIGIVAVLVVGYMFTRIFGGHP